MAPLADPECERDVIATMLRGGEPCYQALTVLAAHDFSDPDLGLVFSTIAGLVAQGRDVSYPAVRLALPREHRDLADRVMEAGLGSPAMLPAWVDRIAYLSRLRQLRALCHDVADTLDAGIPDDPDYLTAVSDRLAAVLSGVRAQDLVVGPDRWPDGLYEEACRRREESERYGYLRWGMAQLERAVALQPKDMLVLAAETGRGKTNLALGLAFAVSVKGKRAALYVNSEMGWEHIAMRLGAMGTGVSAHRIRTGMLSEHDLALLDRFRREAVGNRLWLTDAIGTLTPERVIALARQYRAAGMELLVVDYVQRLFGGRRSAEEKEWEILLSVVQRLKSLAQELGIIVVVVAQLNPEGYLARARQMAQEADAMVTLCHVDDLPADQRKKMPSEVTHVARIVKSRHGPDRQEIALRFEPEWLRFEEVPSRAR